MNYPCIRFYTNEHTSFYWKDGWTNLTEESLETLLFEGRLAIASMEAELQRRRQRLVRKPKIEDCHQRLQKTAKKIMVRKRLDDTAAAQASTLRNLLAAKQSDRKLRLYQEFLCDVIRECGRGIALLCALALGKHRVSNMKEEERLDLLELLRSEHERLGIDELEKLAKGYRLPVEAKLQPWDLSVVPQKRPWNDVNPTFLEEGQYCLFSFMRRNMVEYLPEPFRSGMEKSSLWKKEGERGGLAVTNCLSMYLPETAHEDAFFVARIGYNYGFEISNLFGLGDPECPGSRYNEPE
ncbi:hypothetical protein BBP40_003094 [Aspergillus hancockii]|nr:hypothetical protein BBP40_003094 [Aspergillus hancockii]